MGQALQRRTFVSALKAMHRRCGAIYIISQRRSYLHTNVCTYLVEYEKTGIAQMCCTLIINLWRCDLFCHKI